MMGQCQESEIHGTSNTKKYHQESTGQIPNNPEFQFSWSKQIGIEMSFKIIKS